MTRRGERRSARWSLATRLRVGSVLVLAVCALAAVLVAGLVGPPLFHEHLLHADLSDRDEAILHAEEAFRYASAIALAFAIGAAALAALALTRTPVATIAAYLEAVEDGVRPFDSTTIQLLHEQALRLTRISEDLAAVTEAESGELQLELRTTTPADLVRSALAAGSARAAAGGVHLEGGAPEELPTLRVDPLRMGQVLDNLVSNAIRHTPAGGRVTVAAGRTSAGGVRLTVTDTGDGLAAEHLPHVFERFYRVDTARDRGHGGSGIGLAISLALAHAHGGTITAASAGRGEGSVFTVVLPR